MRAKAEKQRKKLAPHTLGSGAWLWRQIMEEDAASRQTLVENYLSAADPAKVLVGARSHLPPAHNHRSPRSNAFLRSSGLGVTSQSRVFAVALVEKLAEFLQHFGRPPACASACLPLSPADTWRLVCGGG
jgi:hypothetical protein